MFEQKDFSFIHKYFIAEKQGSLFLLSIGIAAVLLAIIFFFFIKTNASFYKGAAVILMALGLIQAMVGFTIYKRTDKQKTDIAYNVGLEPVTYTNNSEMPRITKVIKSLVVYRWAEITCAFIGIVLWLAYKANPSKSFLAGFGMALAIQAIILLGVDFFAGKRAGTYRQQLEKIMITNKT